MIKRKELQYRILKYVANNLKKNSGLSVKSCLQELGLSEFENEAQDIAEELKNKGYVEILEMNMGRKVITRLRLDGKYFIEEFLKDNSNLNELTALIDRTEGLSFINIQLKNAYKYLTSNDSSDYRNAVKEAIGAVESILQKVLVKEKITVGQAVKELSKGNSLHPAFANGISSLYGFNSDAGGIRHGLKEEDFIPDYTEAKFIVNIYSSFVNYIAETYNLI
jgi:hypothetical protein